MRQHLVQDALNAQQQHLVHVRMRLNQRTTDAMDRIRSQRIGWCVEAIGTGHGLAEGRYELDGPPQPSVPRNVEEQI